jgi:oligopeptide transport system substrate-binding protein
MAGIPNCSTFTRGSTSRFDCPQEKGDLLSLYFFNMLKRIRFTRLAQILLPAAASLAVLLFLGCGGGGGERQDAARKASEAGVLLIGNGAEPQALDPHLVTGVPENNVISALMEGLVAYHPTDDNEPEPGVAESWEHGGDFRVWTFHLRADARWSNGDPVTAGDFAYSYRRMLSPVLGANKYADMLYFLENGEAYHQGEIEDFAEVGVDVLDERTLRLKLEGSVPYFPNVLKHYSWFPVHPPTIEKYGGMNNAQTRWFREEYIGNGAFTLAEWQPNSIIRVEKNPAYWDADRVQLNEIHFLPIDDRNTEVNMFRAGELHITNSVPPERIQLFRETMPDKLVLEPYLGTYFYRFNVEREPLDDPRVRRALSLAIDRRQIVENITRGDQTPASGFTPPGISGYPALDLVEHNPMQARELLAEAGFPGGEGFPEFDILYNTDEAHKLVAQAIQAMWKSELGIDVGLFNQEWKVYLPRQQNLQYDISRSGWIGDYPDPKTFLSMWTTGNGNNNTGWSDPEYDAILQQALQTADPASRFDLLRRAERHLLRAAPVAPIYWYTRIYLKDPRVGGWHSKLLDNHPYKYVYFQTEEVAGGS